MANVHFTYRTAEYWLVYPDALVNLALPNKKKLFRMMLSEPWNNAAAIAATVVALDQLVTDSKEDWLAASVAFQKGYVDTKFRYELTKAQVKKANANNKKLLDGVKRTKATHERMLKIKAAYEEVAAKTGG